MTRTTVQRATRDVGGLGGAAAGLLFTTAIAGAGRLAEDPFPAPGSSAEVIRTYYRGSALAARFNVACQALSVVAHARYVVAMARLASQHRTHPQVLGGVVLVAGGATVAALAASAATQAGLTVPSDRTDSEVLATTRRVFVFGVRAARPRSPAGAAAARRAHSRRGWLRAVGARRGQAA